MNNDSSGEIEVPARALTGVSELNYDSASSRQRIKGYFVERDKTQIKQYINDLEKTISLNKGIIGNLITNNCDDKNYKQILKSLNEENEKLHLQLKSVIKERDYYQSKLLIDEQIIEDNKGKKNTYENQMIEKNEELLDQLNKKEYALQSYENKYYTLLTAIKRHAGNNKEIANVVTKLNTRIDKSKTITNIVKENNSLLAQLQTANNRIRKLEEKLSELKDIKKLANISSKEKNLLKVAAKKIEENELIKSALKEMQSKNESLSLKLIEANKEIKKLKLEIFKMAIEERNISLKRPKSEISADTFDANSGIMKDDIREFMSND